LANRPKVCEVFVVLLRPYDDPYDVRGEVRFISGDARGGLAGAVNLVLRSTAAHAIHVLLCGTEVQEGWADAALVHLEDSRIAAVAPLVLDVDDPSRIVAAGLAYHVGGAAVPLAAGQTIDSLGTNARRVLAPHPAAAFHRRPTLEDLGGIGAAAGELLAGVDAGLTLEHLGLATVLEPRSRVAAPRAASLRTSTFRQGLEAERLFWRWAPILGWTRSLASHAALMIGEGLRGVPDLSIVPRWAGRLAGACRAVLEPDRRRALEELRERCCARRAGPSSPTPHFRTPCPTLPRANGRQLRRTGSSG